MHQGSDPRGLDGQTAVRHEPGGSRQAENRRRQDCRRATRPAQPRPLSNKSTANTRQAEYPIATWSMARRSQSPLSQVIKDMFISSIKTHEETEEHDHRVARRQSRRCGSVGAAAARVCSIRQTRRTRERGEDESDYQGRAIRTLKRFARSYDCGVLVAAHPTKDREVAERRNTSQSL